MGNSIQFSMGLDNRQYLGALKQSQRETDNVSKKMQEAFGTKLKQLLTFTAVEEGVRRTAEWAAELNRASKALGVTAEQLQTLQHIGSKTGTGESAMISLFENIQKSFINRTKTQKYLQTTKKLMKNESDSLTLNEEENYG